MKTLNRHFTRTFMASVAITVALSACGGSDEQPIVDIAQRNLTVIRELPAFDPLFFGVQPRVGSATRALAQLTAANVSFTNQRCDNYASQPFQATTSGGPSYLLVEIDVSQLALAQTVGFIQLAEKDKPYFKNPFDCATRAL